MPRSGAKINESVPAKYRDDFKMSKDKKIKWQMYRVVNTESDAMEWQFDNQGENINQLADAVPADDCACIFAEIEDSMADGTTKSKLTCIQWNPDRAPIKLKMKFASSIDQLKSALDFMGKSLQFSEPTELLEKSLKDEALGGFK